MTRSRKSPSPTEQIKVWVRAGGHCTICHRYLLESEINSEFEKLGELAHIVASTNSPLAPRGLSELPENERNLAENLMLTCAHCHNDIDKRQQAQRLDVSWLIRAKTSHEDRIRTATALAARDKTVVFRLVGTIRGASTEITGLEAVAAINSTCRKAPDFALDPNRSGPEIDLRCIPGEDNPIESNYYKTACKRIDEIISERLKPAVERKDVQHLSVFGLARLPLLVYFGSRLDDTISTEIYQRHRSTESWVWGDDSEGLRFDHGTLNVAPGNLEDEAVLVLNVSGTVDQDAIPTALTSLTRFAIQPKSGEPYCDAISSRASRESYSDSLRKLLGHLEAKHKKVKTLHVFAAAPACAAIILGRSIGWGFHPNLVIYDHDSDKYENALEVSAP